MSWQQVHKEATRIVSTARKYREMRAGVQLVLSFSLHSPRDGAAHI